MRFSYLLFLFLTIAALAYSAPMPDDPPAPTTTDPSVNTQSRLFRLGKWVGEKKAKIKAGAHALKEDIVQGAHALKEDIVEGAQDLRQDISEGVDKAKVKAKQLASDVASGVRKVGDALETGAEVVAGGAILLGEGAVDAAKRAAQAGKDAVRSAKASIDQAGKNFDAGEKTGEATG